jgi:hypothetical protein
MSCRLLAIAACTWLSAAQSAATAQNITLQQPAIRSFSVGTVVSVPDSGRGFLGRVARAGESQKSFGPFPSGTSTGWFREHAGMSASVRIHDLREMDERLLREGRNAARIPTGRRLSGNGEHAYQALIGRYESRAGRRSTIGTADSSRHRSTADAGNDTAALFYRLGLQAERRGHHALALRDFRIAAKSGSKAAQRKLAAPRLAARSR